MRFQCALRLIEDLASHVSMQVQLHFCTSSPTSRPGGGIQRVARTLCNGILIQLTIPFLRLTLSWLLLLNLKHVSKLLLDLCSCDSLLRKCLGVWPILLNRFRRIIISYTDIPNDAPCHVISSCLKTLGGYLSLLNRAL
jgi:hypothetical protein